ncbi:hypothetical protein AB7282_03745 [Providencia huaxiensis]|uniref:hypothetical protein n=1 Tax=Providencia TaxID=586 RepID=UPI000C7F44EB|nr:MULTISPECIES: hypothetical protein [Providencia]AXH61780.1 hypothetical protein CYG50_06975 [Providencia huaxiensis]MBN6363581.1 hypothetical protein [Providencia huaxiensis]MCD2528015.1 hypothetical protein [Providencia huaxiensis]
MLKNKNIYLIKILMLTLLFIINSKANASPLNPNSIYTTSIKHPLISDAYNVIPKTLGPYFLYIPDEIKNSTNTECNITVIATGRSSTGSIQSMATPDITLLSGFSSIYNLGVVKYYSVTRNTPKHCSEVLPDFGVKFGQFNVRYINFFDYSASATGYADTCLQIIVNDKTVGTTCSVNVPEIPVLPSCNVSMPLTISHGNVNSNNINGNIAKIDGSISCTGDMSATFQFLPENKIDLLHGVESQLDVCVSGKCMSNNLVQTEIKKNTNLPFSISSTLSALGNPEPGSRVGNAILSVVIN